MLINFMTDKNKWKNSLFELASYVAENGISKEAISQSAFAAKKHISLNEIDEMRRELQYGKGYVLIRGCPTDDLLDVLPSEKSRPESKSWISELVLLGTTHALGFNPFGFLQEKNGKLVHEVVPIEGKENTASSNGSIEFKLHADGAYLPREIRPETLTLICLNNDANTNTKLVSLEYVIQDLSLHMIEILSSKNFVHIPPTTFEVGATSEVVGSILDKVDGHWELKIATHSCRPINEAARKALEQFTLIAEQKSFSHDWKIGDLLVFNNFRCLHGRGEISGRRWLQRCYASRSVESADVIDLTRNAQRTS